jgi:hypothetical protein
MFTRLPGKGNYQRRLLGMLPCGLLHVFTQDYQELPENSPKSFLLALKRVTGNGENATKQQSVCLILFHLVANGNHLSSNNVIVVPPPHLSSNCMHNELVSEDRSNMESSKQ